MPIMAQTTKPTYAENLLYHTGFVFQPRTGEQMDLDRISAVDIPAIIRDVDTEKLSSLLEVIKDCCQQTNHHARYDHYSVSSCFSGHNILRPI